MRRQIADRAQGLASDDRSPVPLDTPATRARLARMERAIRGARGPGFDQILTDMSGELRAVAAEEPRFLTSLIRTVSPVDLPIKQPNPLEISKIVSSRPFQGRLLRQWTSQLAQDERRRMMNEIRIGLTQGETATQITRRIVGSGVLGGRDGVTNLTRSHVQTLVRTAINHVGTSARREFALANQRLFKREQWVAVLDGRTSVICLNLNGRLFPVGKGIFPPAHLNCRSIRSPFIDTTEAVRHRLKPTEQKRLLREFGDQEGLGRVRSRRDLSRTQKKAFDTFARVRVREMIGASPPVMSTEDFLNGLPMGELEDVLGVSKAALQRRGGLSIGRLVDRQGSPLTLASLAEKESAAFQRAGLEQPDV